MKNISIKQNMILNSIKILFSILFPLITFPYATRVLNVENIGKINFSNSIISYFVLIAGLGIVNYAVREGSLFKENKQEFNKFANEIFTINIISTIASYLLLFILIFTSKKLIDYKWILLIQSLVLIFTTIGIDWVNSIYEDFLYITTMTILFQFISLILLFVLVKKESDYYIYAFITVFANVGYNFLNFFHSRKYVRLRFVAFDNLRKHIKPILIIFSTAIATTIYVNSGATILGYISGDYYVGLYAVSIKVYSIFKQLLQGIVIVTLPRLSFLYAKNFKNEFVKLLQKIFSLMALIGIPICIGAFILSRNIIVFISNEDYIQATSSLKFLSLALIFSAFATLATTSILLAKGQEKDVFKASLIGSIINIVLNFILIPFFNDIGASIATLIAEFAILIISMKYTNIKYSQLFSKLDLICCSIESIFIILLYLYFSKVIKNDLWLMICVFLFSILIYIIILKIFNHPLLKQIFIYIKEKYNFIYNKIKIS